MGCFHPGRSSFVQSIRLEAGSVGTIIKAEERPVVVEVERQPRTAFREGYFSSGTDDDDDEDDDDDGEASDSSVEVFPGDSMLYLPLDRRPSQEDNEGLDLIYSTLDSELAGVSPAERDTTPGSTSGSGLSRDVDSESGLSMIEQNIRETFGGAWPKVSVEST